MNDVVALETRAINPRHNLPVSAGAIIPQNMDDAFRLAQIIHVSGLQPKDLDTPQKVMVAILHGMEIGLKPMQAVQRIAVINGRPTIWGDAALSIVRASSLCEWVREGIDGTGDGRVAFCEAKRRNDPEPVRRTFSVDDAKEAGLWQTDAVVKRKSREGSWYEKPNDSPWFRFKPRMLAMRARGFCLRDAFPDVLGGMYLREELEEDEPRDLTPSLPTPPVPPTPPAAQVAAAVDAVVEAVTIPTDALDDFDKFHSALDACPTLDSLNATFAALTKNMADPNDLDEADAILREVASKFPIEDEQSAAKKDATNEHASQPAVNRSQPAAADYRGPF